MSVKMLFPILVECDECDEYYELSYELNLKAASRYKKVFTPKWISTLYKSAREEARINGWFIEADRCYCPKCIAQMEENNIKPKVRANSFQSCIDEISFRHKLHQIKEENNDN